MIFSWHVRLTNVKSGWISILRCYYTGLNYYTYLYHLTVRVYCHAVIPVQLLVKRIAVQIYRGSVRPSLCLFGMWHSFFFVSRRSEYTQNQRWYRVHRRNKCPDILEPSVMRVFLVLPCFPRYILHTTPQRLLPLVTGSSTGLGATQWVHAHIIH